MGGSDDAVLRSGFTSSFLLSSIVIRRGGMMSSSFSVGSPPAQRSDIDRVERVLCLNCVKSHMTIGDVLGTVSRLARGEFPS